MRYLVIGWEAKEGAKESSSVRGYAIKDNEAMPPHSKIRADCLSWANRDGDNFQYFKILFMKYMNKRDYESFMDMN